MFTRATQCVRGVLDPPVSAFSLSLYRHPFLYTLFSSRFTLIINNKKCFPAVSFCETTRTRLTICLPAQRVRGVLDPPVSAFSLSMYRHPFLYTLFNSHFTLIINNSFIYALSSWIHHTSSVCETRNFLVLVCSLSSHRHSYIDFIFSSRFIDS